MNLATFLLILAILGIVLGILNKGFRVISFFVALLAIVLLIGQPSSQGNFFANLFNPPSRTAAPNTTSTFNTETGQTETTTAPQTRSGDLPSQAASGTPSSTTGTTGTTGTTASGTGTRTGTGTNARPFNTSNRSNTSTGFSTTQRRPRALW